VKVSLRQLHLNDLEIIKDWYSNIDGAKYLSRYKPKNFDGKQTIKAEEYAWYIAQVNEIDCGMVFLEKENLSDDIATLGIMIGQQEYWGKGIGKDTISLIIKRSQGILSFNKVRLNVKKTNTRALRCYTNYGFCISGEGEKVASDGLKVEFFNMILNLT
jgi:RimJ/RimL family protein N-acetyltransferase